MGTFLSRTAGRLAKDKAGNLAVAGAIALPLVLFAGGVAVDTTNMMMAKNTLQNAADTGALAASSGLSNKTMTIDQAKAAALDYVKMAAHNLQKSSMTDAEKSDFDTKLKAGTTVDIVDETPATAATGVKSYNVTVTTAFAMQLNAMTKLVSSSDPTIRVSSQSKGQTESKNALSMFLVLDRSGSMAWRSSTVDTTATSCYIYEEAYWPRAKWNTPCYVSKVETLKKAVGSLVAQLNTADPTATYVRTAAVSYNDEQDKAGTLAWGTAAALSYVNLLSATGGTDSSDAFKTAYNAISTGAETNAHINKTGIQPTKYIVFMTDGENTSYNGKDGDTNAARADADTKTYCDNARTAGIKVFTVAFMAPTRGQNLLQSCATDKSYYFPAENSDDLVAAFKAIGEKASKLDVRLTQ